MRLNINVPLILRFFFSFSKEIFSISE